MKIRLSKIILRVLILGLLLILIPPMQAQQVSSIYQDPPQSLMWSPSAGMGPGIHNILAGQGIISRAEDQLIHTQWWDESTIHGKGLGIGARFSKLLLLDLPVDYFSTVLLHEYYGHGARYREFDINDVDYGFDLPPPYGPGGGHASSTISPGVVSTDELILIWTGGFEVQQLLNRQLRRQWMVLGEQHYREAMLYFWSFQIGMNYIQESSGVLSGQTDLNDPQAYVSLLNLRHGNQFREDWEYTLNDLKQDYLLSALDPMLYISIYNGILRYLWDGRALSDIPMIKIGRTDYLFSIYRGLTPFGVQTYFEHHFLLDEVLYQITFKQGDDRFSDWWGGFGALISNPYTRSTISVDLEVNTWIQPVVQMVSGEEDWDKGKGGSLAVRTYLRPKSKTLPLKAIVELGYKTRGYLAGHTLDAGPILNLGVQFY